MRLIRYLLLPMHRALSLTPCVQDRCASGVVAVHKAVVDEMTVPYIRPSENGGRTQVQWCQFRERRANHIVRASSLSAGMRLDAAAPPDTPPSSAVRQNVSFTMDSQDDASDILDRSRSNTVSSNFSLTNVMSSGSLQDASRIGGATKATGLLIHRSSASDTTTSTFQLSAQRFTTEDLALATHFSELERSARKFVCVNVDAFSTGVGGDDAWSVCGHEEAILTPGVYEYEMIFSLFHV